VSRPAGRVIGAIAVVLALAGCSGSSQQCQTFTGPGYEAKLFTTDLAKAPEFRETTVTGQPLSLAAYRGHVVVLNFWGSWCDTCRAEAPALGVVARKLYPTGVRFIGVDMRDEPTSALAFMQTFRITYPSVNDTAGTVALDYRDTVPMNALPDTVIINRTGRVAATIIGSATYANLMMLIVKVGQDR
jgi:thiol-disulfide isomerase/thioredoxin